MSIFEMLFSLMFLFPVIILVLVVSIVTTHFMAFVLTKGDTWKTVVVPFLETIWDNAKAYPAEFLGFWKKYAPKAETVVAEESDTTTEKADAEAASAETETTATADQK